MPPVFFYAEKESFFLHRETKMYFSLKKSTKSHQRRASRPPLKTTSHPVDLAAKSHARQVCATNSKAKSFCQSLRISSSIPRVRTQHPAKSEQIRRGVWCHSVAFDALSSLAKNPSKRAVLDDIEIGSIPPAQDKFLHADFYSAAVDTACDF